MKQLKDFRRRSNNHAFSWSDKAPHVHSRRVVRARPGQQATTTASAHWYQRDVSAPRVLAIVEVCGSQPPRSAHPRDVHQMFRHSREYRCRSRLDTPETQTFPLTRAAGSVRHRFAPSKRWRHQNSRPQSDRVSKRGHVRHHGAKAPDELHKGIDVTCPSTRSRKISSSMAKKRWQDSRFWHPTEWRLECRLHSYSALPAPRAETYLA